MIKDNSIQNADMITISPDPLPTLSQTITLLSLPNGEILTMTIDAVVIFEGEGRRPKIMPTNIVFSDPICDFTTRVKYYAEMGSFDYNFPFSHVVADTEFYLTIGNDVKATVNICSVNINQNGVTIAGTKQSTEKTLDVYFEYTHPKEVTYLPTSMPEQGDSSSSSSGTNTTTEQDTYAVTEMIETLVEPEDEITELPTEFETPLPEPSASTEQITELPTEMIETVVHEPTDALAEEVTELATEITTELEEYGCEGCDGHCSRS